jgi:hypothetical protein
MKGDDIGLIVLLVVLGGGALYVFSKSGTTPATMAPAAIVPVSTQTSAGTNSLVGSIAGSAGDVICALGNIDWS